MYINIYIYIYGFERNQGISNYLFSVFLTAVSTKGVEINGDHGEVDGPAEEIYDDITDGSSGVVQGKQRNDIQSLSLYDDYIVSVCWTGYENNTFLTW